MTTSMSGWEQVAMAIHDVRSRLLRCSSALEAAGIQYAVAGGNAVAEWVGRIDKAAVRFTQDVDLLIRREDLPQIIEVLERSGFVFHESFGVSFFLDGPDASPRDAVHLIFGGEKVKAHEPIAAPDVTDCVAGNDFTVVTLESLVAMKLTAYRRKDQVHLLDMLDVGLIDHTWPSKFPSPLGDRLQELIDHPD